MKLVWGLSLLILCGLLVTQGAGIISEWFLVPLVLVSWLEAALLILQWIEERNR